MIRQKLHIERYDWTVYAYYAVHSYYRDEILSLLQDIGCEGEYFERARENLDSGGLNHGLTFSNVGESVMVVGLTSSASEFLNSLAHELHHLVCHICEARGIDIESEEAAYLMGDTAGRTLSSVRPLICDFCGGRTKYREL